MPMARIPIKARRSDDNGWRSDMDDLDGLLQKERLWRMRGKTPPWRVLSELVRKGHAVPGGLTGFKLNRPPRERPPRPAGLLSGLPALDENGVPYKAKASATFTSVMKQVWDSQSLYTQLYFSDPAEYRRRTEEQREQLAWDQAVAWIAAKHAPEAPEPPLEMTWDWPSREVSQSPYLSRVGDLEYDLDDDEDW